MTAHGLTEGTTARDLGDFVLVERKGLHAAGPARAMTSRNELGRSGSGEREPRFIHGAVHA